MIPQLSPAEARVLGVLIEKEITTPEYYPLTMNALVSGCNQKSNRQPVVSFDEELVSDVVDLLREKRFASVVTGGSNRVPKYAHRGETLNLGRRELALMCELLLRGPETAGELRANAARMHRFTDAEEVESCLNTLMDRPDGAFVTRLPRQPGSKEPRFAHLLCGEIAQPANDPGEALPVRTGNSEHRVTALEAEVAELRARVSDLDKKFADFRRQFE